MGLTTTIKAAIDLRLTGTPDLGSAEWKYPGHASKTLANGTAANQASKVFSDTRSIAASSSEDLDLSGSLVDPLGNAVVFTAIKAILIKAAVGNTNNVVVGGAASNQFQGPFGDVADTIAVKPGGELLLTAPGTGWAVTAGTGDLLKLANSGAGSAVGFDIIIVGI